MSKFKDNMSSVVFMWIGFGLAVVAVLMMFVPGIEYLHISASKDIFFNVAGGDTHANLHGAWPVFMGYMLLVLGGLILAVLGLPFINKDGGKAEKIALLSAGIALLAGTVLVFLTKVIYVGIQGNDLVGSKDAYTQLAGPYVAGALGALAFICDGVAFYLDM